MAIPTGSGSEVLKVAHVAGVTNSENVLINGVANHDKLVLSGTDHLCMITASASNIDVTISYIDQDWS